MQTFVSAQGYVLRLPPPDDALRVELYTITLLLASSSFREEIYGRASISSFTDWIGK